MKSLWNNLKAKLGQSKRNAFLGILLAIGAISVIGSIIASQTVLKRPEGPPLRVALIAPQEGIDKGQGEAMQKGLQLALDQINAEGGVGGRPIDLLLMDEDKLGQFAFDLDEKLQDDQDIIAIVGPWTLERVGDVALVAGRHEVPMIVPSSAKWRAVIENDTVYSTVFDRPLQTRFLANYNRNVLGEKTASVIYSDTPLGLELFTAFDKTYRRFGTRVLNSWAYKTGDPVAVRARAKEIAAEFKKKKLSGTIFIEGNAVNAAPMLVALRDAGVRNPIIGLADLATNVFAREVTSLAALNKTAADYLNGLMVTTPLLFDTATETAQKLRSEYLGKYATPPDWTAAFSYDAGTLITRALKKRIKVLQERGEGRALDMVSGHQLRVTVKNFMKDLNRPESAVPVAAGSLYFNKQGLTALPIQVGEFNGANMISAPTQLLPITEGGVTGYLDLLKQGKVLYVNDRFMYRTNVVYAGVQLNDVRELDVDGKSALLDFLIWFRYRGDFAPENIVFDNAIEEITLGEPVREGKDDDMIYKAYQVSGKFALNFTLVDRSYGSQLVGVSFNHRLLSKNNLMYVTDVLGMGLASNQSLLDVLKEDQLGVSEGENDGESDRFSELAGALGQGEAGNALLQALSQRRVLAPLSGWEAQHAWISQELFNASSEGDPSYIGYGKPKPDFSQINFGMIIEPERIDARDFIPANWFVYVVITSIVAILFALGMDRRDRGQFWRMQTLLLRAVAWPALMLAGGALILDHAVSNFNESTVDLIVKIYESLWWLIPARILAIAVERFIWVPLELRTQRKIPNVVRAFGAVSIYLLAIFSVLAFVFDQKLTSLLATSGLLAMIIGLAIQANIANIFSGIVLNIERPFQVGDWIELADVDMPSGTVDDITWRTTRLVTVDGYSISVPNAQVSESKVVNYTYAEKVRIVVPFFVDVNYDPKEVIAATKKGLATCADVLFKDGDGNPMVASTTSGTEVVERDIYGRFVAIYWLKSEDYAKRYPIQGQCMSAVWRTLEEQGIQYRRRDPGDFDSVHHKPD